MFKEFHDSTLVNCQETILHLRSSALKETRDVGNQIRLLVRSTQVNLSAAAVWNWCGLIQGGGGGKLFFFVPVHAQCTGMRPCNCWWNAEYRYLQYFFFKTKFSLFILTWKQWGGSRSGRIHFFLYTGIQNFFVFLAKFTVFNGSIQRYRFRYLKQANASTGSCWTVLVLVSERNTVPHDSSWGVIAVKSRKYH